ncbi:MAG: hypothetical protein D6723_03665 [Acidobacteria bacterium]|nr:MAG: hypothetical protein D6723_03665 [Acidobacteriota bacterium]
MGRTKEIMITYHRRRIRTSWGRKVNACPLCGSRLDMITLAAAVESTGIDQSTLQEWIILGTLHTERGVDDHYVICRGCLDLMGASTGIARDGTKHRQPRGEEESDHE